MTLPKPTDLPLWQAASQHPHPGGSRTGGRRPNGYQGLAEPFQLTSPVTPEADLHIAVARALNVLLLPPTMWCTYVAGHDELTAATAERHARVGVKPGWPDILVVHRAVYGLELKHEDGDLTVTREVRTRRGALRIIPGQAETFPKLEAAGMQIAIARSVGEALAALEGWGVSLRAHA
jgi:hypothetical protein